ncbi:pyruvate dehydrogenase E2 component (dihydrolipoamide acetyltransferase) [Leucobacter luti]|uniref:dihydrolipoamide acetyltransferase family protein n=1 Tax=Leucobacter luti TaxID=340320 RepID=UPI00104633C7|nr:dihydrolipoamide acetyltransferase family protein [Leucobacter luti]MCW2289239.1 pyruvate dehydrogenase E2 component (dihydrolipoamide acetyltransferase) [Leucobacter luti]TCK39802.1 pyruvate dehydrogenase E2 component (dihydrolipoamide acetyltransferase) [Leucobacter luti]
MTVIVRMPEIATGSDEAAIAGWLVAVGETVAVGQALVEIETEKATVEFEAEQPGTLAGILLAAGSTAPVGAPIAVLAADGESMADALAAAGAAGAGTAPSAEAGADQAHKPVSAEAAVAPTAVPVPVPVQAAAAPEAPGARRFVSPLVRKLARERGIELVSVRGSGPGGRIVRRDLDGIGGGTAAPAAIPQPAQPSLPPQPAAAPLASTGASASAEWVDVPHTGMRRAIARRLAESKSTVPHFYLVADCRVDALLELRSQINAVEGVRVSVNDFVVKAVAGAFRDVPAANAIWTEEATRRFTGVDIAVAVSVPTGLLTPVVRGVERMSLGELGTAIRDLAGRAREGKLKQHELEGGSFSVSNLGMYGTSEFAAILNPPQSGILAVGAAQQRPVVQADGTVGVGTVMTVTLSADHRVLDGALAAEWLAAFTQRIENPLSILV